MTWETESGDKMDIGDIGRGGLRGESEGEGRD